MKLASLAAAGLVAIAGLAGTAPASAQRTVVRETTVVHQDRGWHHHRHQVCETRFRHGHRVRVCRSDRY